ncbi:MAG TPA: shikimate kinase [Blastocatellia bacterium]|nr:shikimate kinase [Blastocatellia bacterium]HMY76508.1 shikimate kinase [Blastocatellia bacterium]
MACGKTTVGPALAARLGRRFVDLDPLIVAEAGCSIADLIAREGEARFRQIETEMIHRTAQAQAVVIAPGGGAITRQENRDLMKAFGLTVWLDAPFELCWRRIGQDEIVRPLAPDEATARERYEARLPLYRQADLRVAVNESQSPEEIAAAIVELLSRRHFSPSQ